MTVRAGLVTHPSTISSAARSRQWRRTPVRADSRSLRPRGSVTWARSGSCLTAHPQCSAAVRCDAVALRTRQWRVRRAGSTSRSALGPDGRRSRPRTARRSCRRRTTGRSCDHLALPPHWASTVATSMASGCPGATDRRRGHPQDRGPPRLRNPGRRHAPSTRHTPVRGGPSGPTPPAQGVCRLAGSRAHAGCRGAAGRHPGAQGAGPVLAAQPGREQPGVEGVTAPGGVDVLDDRRLGRLVDVGTDPPRTCRAVGGDDLAGVPEDRGQTRRAPRPRSRWAAAGPPRTPTTGTPRPPRAR